MRLLAQYIPQSPRLVKRTIETLTLTLFVSLSACEGRHEPPASLEPLPATSRHREALVLHQQAFVADLHNDILLAVLDEGHQLGDRHQDHDTDIPRLREGGIDAQVFAVWVSPSFLPDRAANRARDLIAVFDEQLARNPHDLGLALRAGDIARLNQQGKIAGILGIEGGHAIENKIENLRMFYDQGVRLVGITWNNSTDWADAAADATPSHDGLTEFGRQVIQEMNRLGMLIDISHAAATTVEDILVVSTHPIVASHSDAAALNPHFRNLTDDQIHAIARNGGVIGVNFFTAYLQANAREVPIDRLIDHIDHIVELAGPDHVALGSDFDGVPWTPTGLEDVAGMPRVTEALLQRGYSEEDIRKILGGNFLRVFRQVCGE
ncbi:MAG: membrane dipeptidase [Candidatus Latescibacteria bacterium]|nr:membrane dipeptidase [Candidatus Latescibacterota bacterium]